ncbi:hypothetical protein G9P44_004119 [Scheffersomyces stipitis]|nr:hypothetical protein G9P44_004119 [Scheffersomyces stipitis]
MVRLGSIAAFTALLTAPLALAQDVACQVNGVTVQVVDLATGVCTFPIPAELPTIFEFNSIQDFNVEFYYTIVNNIRYFTDIVNAGRTIEIPAIELYGGANAPLYQVHVEEHLASNTTLSIRKRLLKQVELNERDAASDFADSLKTLDGTLVSDTTFSVVDATGASSSSEGTGASTGAGASSEGGATTVTDVATTVVTITSCSEDKCSLATVPATPKLTTETINGVVTSYTTYCPLTEVTELSTTVVTITSCKEDKCVLTTVPATPSEATTTVEGVETIYTTYCPISEETPYVTVSGTPVPATPAVVSKTTEGVVTSYTTLVAVTETVAAAEQTPAAPGAPEVTPAAPGVETVASAPGSTVAPINTFEGAAVSNYGKSLLAIALIPLAYLI